MTQPYPNDAFLQGYFAPMGVECDAPDLVVDGELPSDLAGTYYRNTDDRVGTKAYRHGYAVGTDGDSMLSFSHVLHYDTHAGNRRRTWTPGANYQLGEAVFAPRAGSTREGDGYLMVLGFNGDTQKSDFFVLRADDIEAGPVATAHLPIRIPAGFHGSWVPR